VWARALSLQSAGEWTTRFRVQRRRLRELQGYVFPVLLAVFALSLVGALCGEKSAADPKEAKRVIEALDDTETRASAGPREPIRGVDLGGLDSEEKARFDALVDSLSSPCGKAHSLRTSANSDKSCKRALFAARYVAFLIGEGDDDTAIRELYDGRYKQRKRHEFTLAGRPHKGPAEARVKLVEFYDYGCPACRHVAMWFQDFLSEHPNDMVLYYKQFPITGHLNTRAASQAALAAHKQGKFDKMHEALFAMQGRHGKADLWGYAKTLGLDMPKFEADYVAVAPMVQADYDEGDKAGVMGTPTIYINGREYDAPLAYEILKRWIEEELAVTR
jgi:protein-disulfide isomerase